MDTKFEERKPKAQAKRTQILSGAKKVFLREGFAAASTDVIAREAEVSKRTLYAYYPSKEELFEDVLRELTVENPQTQVLESARSIDPKSREELREGMMKLAEKFMFTMMEPDYLALLRTIIADSHRFPKLSEIFRSTVPERGIREGTALIRRSQKNGVAVGGDPEVIIRMFIGPLLSYALVDGLFRPEGDPQPPTTGKIKEMVDLYIRAVS